MKSLRLPLLVVFVALLAACASQGMKSAANNENAQLHALFDDYWETYLSEFPTSASYIGDQRFNDRWSDMSLEAHERRNALYRGYLERLAAIDRSELSELDQTNYDLFKRALEGGLADYASGNYLFPMTQSYGVQLAYDTASLVSFENEADYRDWILRLERYGDYVDQNIELLQKGIETGFTQPAVITKLLIEQIEAQRVDDPAASDYYTPFTEMPDAIPEAKQETLRDAGLAAIRDVVLPAYARFENFMREQYLPAARPAVGAWSMPGGREYYAQRVKHYTTTDLTPEEIHQIGLREVARIRAEMEKIIDEVGFEGDFQAFLEYLRTDPKFYFEDPQELLEAYRNTAKRIDPELVNLFHIIPRTPYGVTPIPAPIAPYTYTAYYSGPAADGTRAGYFYVNLYRPEVRPKYEIEALTMHESVPGHHFQIARAMELGKLPDFRRYGESYTAFVEGWALYAESLGEMIGLYQDPYSKFGQLTYEMWRAVRLVVDTGMHYKEWTREQAVDYFMANAAKTEKDINNEIDRYISWPGQALAYKIGELKIKELRARAEAALGEDFDLKAFHDEVLGAGAVPLDVLERRIDAWITEQKRN
ncbi:MAG TPA: DUF885 domain-containing protein [Gammaproteobacteria bacterium]